LKRKRHKELSGDAADKVKVRALKRAQNVQVSYLRSSKEDSVQELADSYNFIAVTERFDESLVVLAHKWGLELVDMLYVRSKDSNLAPTDHTDLKKGVKILPHVPFARESEDVRNAADVFRKRNAEDFELLQIANKRLDAAIEILNREHYPGFVQGEVARFKAMIGELESACRPRFFEGCLWNDNGCAQTCIDEMVSKNRWAKHRRLLFV
jgi:hypothetical protein